MKWSLKIGKFAGIGVYVHWTFFLLLAWVGLAHLGPERSIGSALAAIGFILAVFACVVLHEFGHALTAKRYGIRTRDITLLPIGGLARLERIPRDPIQELWVAIAGPAVNVVIALVLFVWLVISRGWGHLPSADITAWSFGVRLLAVNVVLVLFNALPAFPMDGGRVLRAVLATQMDHTRATQIAATVGQAMALLFGFGGLLIGNPFLLFIALFVWIGAAQEASMVQIQNALAGIPVRRAMVTEFHTAGPGDRVERLVEVMLAGSQRDFPVVEDGRVIGIVTHDELLRALSEGRRQDAVSSVMRRQFQTAEAAEMLESALSRLSAVDFGAMPVTDHGRLAGILTTGNVGEFMRVQAALGAVRRN